MARYQACKGLWSTEARHSGGLRDSDQALINHSDTNLKDLPRVLSRALSALARFAEFQVFHILCEHNSLADRLAKQGSSLGVGEMVVNGYSDYLHIP